MSTLCFFICVSDFRTWISRAINSLSFGYFSNTSTLTGTASSRPSNSFSCSEWQMQHDKGRIQSHRGFVLYSCLCHCKFSVWFRLIHQLRLGFAIAPWPKESRWSCAGKRKQAPAGEDMPRTGKPWKTKDKAVEVFNLCLCLHDCMPLLAWLHALACMTSCNFGCLNLSCYHGNGSICFGWVRMSGLQRAVRFTNSSLINSSVLPVQFQKNNSRIPLVRSH